VRVDILTFFTLCNGEMGDTAHCPLHYTIYISLLVENGREEYLATWHHLLFSAYSFIFILLFFSSMKDYGGKDLLRRMALCGALCISGRGRALGGGYHLSTSKSIYISAGCHKIVWDAEDGLLWHRRLGSPAERLPASAGRWAAYAALRSRYWVCCPVSGVTGAVREY